MKQLSSGAEATIYINSENNIEKKRLSKNYRIPEIDEALRIFRTKREAKVINSLQKLNLPVPKIIKQSEYDIVMEYIDGIQLKRMLDKKPELAAMIGNYLSVMHDNDIIHGDLTTSNMILEKELGKEKLYFIDFGLSFFSKRIEDKAVDIHLFKQALESKHFAVFDEAYRYFLQGYSPKDKKETMERLAHVEQRGRYKERT